MDNDWTKIKLPQANIAFKENMKDGLTYMTAKNVKIRIANDKWEKRENFLIVQEFDLFKAEEISIEENKETVSKIYKGIKPFTVTSIAIKADYNILNSSPLK